MYPIVRKEQLADNIILMDIKAPKNAAPSQDQIDAAKEANKRLNEEIDELKNERKTAVSNLSEYRYCVF